MEKLKSIIPSKLKETIFESTPNDLPSTCSSLNEFLSQSSLFLSMIDDLTNTHLGLCAKNEGAALELKGKANACFSASDFSQALQLYSQALRVAPVVAVDKDNQLVATLYVNRASCFHKLSLLDESLRDCNRALAISRRYAKAWFRRGKVIASLLNYEDAIHDLQVAMAMERTSSGKRQLESHLKLIVSQNKAGSSFSKLSGKGHLIIDEEPQPRLQCVSTPNKGRGMASLIDTPSATLVHMEEPYAAIIMKDFRETHCYFCFNELPADTVPCSSCSIPLYCSKDCQLQAGGQESRKCLINNETANMLSDELERHFSEVTLETHSDLRVDRFMEHGHDCHGVTWPAVLPSDVVLAARVLVKLIELNNHSYERSNIMKNLDLSHNYVQQSPESKLELHVYSIVLIYCLHNTFASKLELNGATFSKVMILISQIKINSMAIVCMKYMECHPPIQSTKSTLPVDDITSNLEQIRVGQAVYLTGSLFNHSCLPNVHAYFISRTLLVRTTEFVAVGCSLELSYGPQVGQWDYLHRQEFLQDHYSFKCQCIGCTRVNVPDLVLNAFHCVKATCLGVVLDHFTAECERRRMHDIKETLELHSLVAQGEFINLFNEEMVKLARLLSQRRDDVLGLQSGCCLNCGSSCDLKSLHATANDAYIHIRSLQEAVDSTDVDADSVSKALSSLEVLKSTLHLYNKKLAEAEDIIAQAFCSVGEMRQARDHCFTSIQILEKLYSRGHIALGHELVKLASIQLALPDSSAADIINRIDSIYSNYYGKHAEVFFPYLQRLKTEIIKLPSRKPS